MLLGAIGCQQCSCQACVPCDAVCDETPDEAFAVVYQVEDQRANLTWTGDAMGPIDGPWPGFESGTVFSQTITSNGIVLPGTRFPCYFRLKLWRNVGGGEGSETLSSQRVTISCTEGKLDLGFVVLNAGESVEFNPNPESANENATYVFPSTAIQLDENGGDRHAFPPEFDWIGGIALCAGTIVSVQAHIEWTNDLIQHNLYGEFVECFDEQECELDCSGTPTEFGSLFLSITNQASTMGNNLGVTVTLENDYVLDIRSDPGLALLYCGEFGAYSFSPPVQFFWTAYAIATYFAQGLFLRVNLGGSANVNDNLFVTFGVSEQDVRDLICGSVASLSGTASITLPITNTSGITGTITFDWELST